MTKKLPAVPSEVPAGQVVAWMWQHEETGAVGFIDQWQVDNGWQKANPRLQLIRPLVFSDGVAPSQTPSDEALMELAREECENFRWPSTALSIMRKAISAAGVDVHGEGKSE